ncbi:MAG: ATP-binding protein [Bacteroidota bacterium]
METGKNNFVNNKTSVANSVNGSKRKKNFGSAVKTVWQTPVTKYFLSALVITVTGIILYYLQLHIGYQSVSLVFLFIVSLLPLFNFKPGQIFLAAVMSAFIWNYYFIPPHFTLRIGKVEDALMFGLYFVIASVSGLLISRIRTQQIQINQKEKKTSALYDLTRELSSSKSLDDVTGCSIRHLKETFHTEVAVIYAENDKKLQTLPHPSSTFKIDEAEWNIAQFVHLNSGKAGRFTDTIQFITPATYYPLLSKEGKLGVLGLIFPEDAVLNNDTQSLLNTFIAQITIAIEREYLKELAKRNLVIQESEKLYKTLFDSVSHELKTPITTILGAVTSLRDEKIIGNKSVLTRLLFETNVAAERLKRLVENLLDITRLESGNLTLKKDWHSVNDLFNLLINKIRKEGYDQNIIVSVNEDAGILFFDYPLIEQALLNIIHNSLEYTPPGSSIEINAKRTTEGLAIIISDNGNGFPEEALKNLFKKFYRVPGTKAGGTGLGLSIAKGFVEAHGGTISVRNRKPNGAEFIILLPFN